MADRTLPPPLLAPPTSALPRPLDLASPSNRLALSGLLAAAGLSRLLGRSWRQALGVGGTAFLAWATARELDPDHDHSAALALGVGGLVSLLQTRAATGPTAELRPPLLPGMAALSALRSLSATVGAAVSPQDALALSAQAALTAVTGTATAGHGTAALIPAAALALSAAEADEFSPVSVWSAPLAAGAGLLPARRARAPEQSGPHLPSDLLSLAALSLGAALTLPEVPSSRCDRVPRTVSGSRLQASRALALGALATALLRRESASLVPLAAATFATGLRRRSAGR